MLLTEWKCPTLVDPVQFVTKFYYFIFSLFSFFEKSYYDNVYVFIYYFVYNFKIALPFNSSLSISYCYDFRYLVLAVILVFFHRQCSTCWVWSASMLSLSEPNWRAHRCWRHSCACVWWPGVTILTWCDTMSTGTLILASELVWRSSWLRWSLTRRSISQRTKESDRWALNWSCWWNGHFQAPSLVSLKVLHF